MMGADWQRDEQQHSVVKKFAWLPKYSNSHKMIWLTDYYVRYTYYDDMGKPPVKGPSWTYTYTKYEYLLVQLKGA